MSALMTTSKVHLTMIIKVDRAEEDKKSALNQAGRRQDHHQNTIQKLVIENI